MPATTNICVALTQREPTYAPITSGLAVRLAVLTRVV